MDKLLKKFLCCSCVSMLAAGVFSAPAYGQNGEIFIIEAGADPNDFGGGPTVVDVTGRLGEEITFEIFINNIGPDPLIPVRGYAADFRCVAEGGIFGSVEYVQGSGGVFQFRDDFMFFQIAVAVGVDQSTCPGGGSPAPGGDGTVRYAVGRNKGASDITGLGPLYGGDFALSISADACGTFTIPLLTDLTTPTGGSGLADDESLVIPAFLRDLVIAAAPLNDGCETAIDAGGGGTFAYNTNCAATDGPAGCPAESDIWYSFTTNCAGIMSAEATSGQVAIYDGLTCIPTDAEQRACGSGRQEVLPVGPGEEFLIRLGSVGGGAITGDITIACSPFCDTDADCTDQSDACNIGRCNPATGCFQEPANENASCDDGIFCTINDACDNGTCVGVDNGVGPCDDRDVCTVDACPAGSVDDSECINAPLNGEACDPAGGDACADAGGTCDAGTSICECVSFLRPDLALDVVGAGAGGCAAVGDSGILTVEVNLGPTADNPDRFPAAPAASGAQLFLTYDVGSLVFLGIAQGEFGQPDGTFVFELFESVDEVAGTIDYAVGVSPGDPDHATGAGRVAVITFRILDSEACSTGGGVAFRAHNPPTRLGATDGTSLVPRRQRIPCVLDGDCTLRPAQCFDGSCTYEEDFVDGVFLDPLNADDVGIDRGAPVLNCPFDEDLVFEFTADCDNLAATVQWDTVVGVDGCDGEILECVGFPEGFENGGEFDPGVTVPFSCTVEDRCGNVSTCSFSILNTGEQAVEVNIEVSPSVADNITRCFTFEVSECGEANGDRTVGTTQDVLLGTAGGHLRGHGTATFTVEPGNWECLSVRDAQHTLTSTCAIECIDGVLTAEFKGGPEFNDSCHWLINGNLNSDDVIDVLDFVIWSGGVRNAASCDPFVLDSDITGDGTVNASDFSFILINFLENDKAGCDEACSGGAGARTPGLAEISVRELFNMGYSTEQIRRADVTGDGMVDMEDMAAYVNGDVPQTRKRATRTRGTIGRR